MKGRETGKPHLERFVLVAKRAKAGSDFELVLIRREAVKGKEGKRAKLARGDHVVAPVASEVDGQRGEVLLRRQAHPKPGVGISPIR